jgi:type IV pilus assembly protein PilQ
MASGFMFDGGSAASAPYAGRRISLDFVNADIHSIFRLISHVSRLNIVSGDDVQGLVTVRMTDVPWDQALAAVLTAKGLGSQRFGNIVRVAPIETIKSEQQSALEAKRAQEELTELELLVLPLNYVQASEIFEQLQDLLSPRGQIQADKTGNQLIIKETEKRLVQLRELIKHLDRQTPQVLIEARVVEANSNFTRSLGVQWGGELDATTRTGYSTGMFFPNGVGLSGAMDRSGNPIFYGVGQESLMVDLGADASNSGVAFNLGSIPGLIDLDARLSAMESDGWGKVVSQPKVTTLDNQEAKVSQGQRIPFLSTSAGGTTVQFISAALEMSVTPHITADDKVFLSVSIQNNRADFSQLVLGQPAIQIKEIETELLVADGDTTVMGGVFSTESSYSQDRVPGFSKIPLLGYLFKNSTEAVTRNELLVFITPHIVTRATRD